MISSVQLTILKILQCHEKQAAELQKTFYNADLIKSPKGIYLCLYKLRDQQMCHLNNQGMWEITETGKQFLSVINSVEIANKKTLGGKPRRLVSPPTPPK